jgi:transcriptional regulator with XRE-family HTH domain
VASSNLIGLSWKLRRTALGLRQQDVAEQVGMSVTRYSQIERGESDPSAIDRQLIEEFLPPLPTLIASHMEEKSGVAPGHAPKQEER